MNTPSEVPLKDRHSHEPLIAGSDNKSTEITNITSSNTSHGVDAGAVGAPSTSDIHVDVVDDHQHAGSSVEGHLCGHSHSKNMMPDTNTTRAIVKAVIMEGSIGIHSVIIGVAQGLLSNSSDDLASLKSLVR